jgi:hypothetical protein
MMTFAILVRAITHNLVILLGAFFLACLAAVVVALLRNAPAWGVRTLSLVNGHRQIEIFLHCQILQS